MFSIFDEEFEAWIGDISEIRIMEGLAAEYVAEMDWDVEEEYDWLASQIDDGEMIGAFPTLTSDVCPTLSEGIQLESHMLKNGFLERTELALTLGEEYDNKRLREQEDAQEYFEVHHMEMFVVPSPSPPTPFLVEFSSDPGYVNDMIECYLEMERERPSDPDPVTERDTDFATDNAATEIWVWIFHTGEMEAVFANCKAEGKLGTLKRRMEKENKRQIPSYPVGKIHVDNALLNTGGCTHDPCHEICSTCLTSCIDTVKTDLLLGLTQDIHTLRYHLLRCSQQETPYKHSPTPYISYKNDMFGCLSFSVHILTSKECFDLMLHCASTPHLSPLHDVFACRLICSQEVAKNCMASLPIDSQLLIRDETISDTASVIHTKALTDYLYSLHIKIDDARHENEVRWCELIFDLFEQRQRLPRYAYLLKAYETFLSPIKNIPDEVVAEVFKFVASAEDGRAAIQVCCLVSHHWRDVINANRVAIRTMLH